MKEYMSKCQYEKTLTDKLSKLVYSHFFGYLCTIKSKKL